MNRLPIYELGRQKLTLSAQAVSANVFAQVFVCVIVGILLTGAVILAARYYPLD